jgi:MFS family permease
VAVSLWGAVGGLAAAIGPSLGSFVVDSVGWPWAFFINLPLGALSIWRGARCCRRCAAPALRAGSTWSAWQWSSSAWARSR